MLATTIIILAVLFMLPGLLGVILPIFPGVPFMFLVALVYGFVTKFQLLSVSELIWLAGLALISVVVDYLAGLLGAKFGGASAKALTVGLIGFVVGMIIFPPLGGLFGMFLGIVITEFYLVGKGRTALKAGAGGLLGALAGMIINLVIGLTFVGLFLFFALNP